MTRVNIVRDKEGFIWEITVDGHAGASGKGDNDIVCAAISAVAFTAINALEELAGIKSYSKKDGCIKCTVPVDIPQDLKPKVKIILDTVAIGFKQIEYTPSYRRYISVLDEEV
jgi:uncharacterized protein YsxB (DUF464 family)